MPMTTALCPAQHLTYERVRAAWGVGPLLLLTADAGHGRTTVLRQLHQDFGGALLTAKELLDASRPQHPLALEETFEQVVGAALAGQEVVFVDDLHLLTDVCESCYFYPRRGLLGAALLAVADQAARAGKRLVVGAATQPDGPLGRRGYRFHIPEYQPADFAFFGRAYLGDAAGRLDFDKIHRFAPRLDGHQLRAACAWLGREPGLATERFIDYLREQRMASNVDLAEVQPVALHDLRGVDDVIASLEANIIVPLEDDELAARLQLRPKRGVLLVGPPGTGKTTVGRALAHRLRSKFFLIDGTFISGTRDFYERVHRVFESAKQNAPSVIFVDDSDVIFESGEELGLYRYLLTMLDGLESASAGRVCVMLTAMDVSHLPPALLRSGRVELWLEMKLPDAAARAAILARELAPVADALGPVDQEAVVEATDQLTGADLKRLVEDSKNLYAADLSRRRPVRPPTDYFLTAIEQLRQNKERYAQAEQIARQRRPQRPVFFDV
jgi:AAA+ superfamily predicted ATPase